MGRHEKLPYEITPRPRRTEVGQLIDDYDAFERRSQETNYTDTGVAWNLLERMATLIKGLFPHEVNKANDTKVEINSPPVTDYPVPMDPVTRANAEAERNGNLGEVIDRRVQVYGEPVAGFAAIAEMWTAYLDHPIQAHEVPMMMLLMKVVRSKTSPDYSDHSDDIEGYLDIFRKVIGEDMIQARSVTEYIMKKWPGES